MNSIFGLWSSTRAIGCEEWTIVRVPASEFMNKTITFFSGHCIVFTKKVIVHLDNLVEEIFLPTCFLGLIYLMHILFVRLDHVCNLVDAYLFLLK